MRVRAHRVIAHLRQQWMGALALFLVLTGGVAYAANTVFSSDIVNNEVYGADVRDDTLAGGGLGHIDLKAGSVRSSEVGADSLQGGDIAADALTDADLASSAQFNGANAGGDLTGGYPGPFIADGAVDSAAVLNDREGCRECGLLGEDIADDTLTGADINETTLSGVNADMLDGADLCRTDGVLTLAGGTVADPPNTQQLCAEGPLSIRAYCDRGFDHGNDFVDAAILIDTSTNGSFFSTTTASDPDFYDIEGVRALTGASTGPPVDHSDPASEAAFEAFAAGAPDGSQLSGTALTHVLWNENSCSFVLNATN